MTLGLAERMLLLFERIGICDQCLAKCRREPDGMLGDLLCPKCLAKHDRVLAIVGIAHMGSLLRKCKDANLNVEGFLFTFCEECSVKLPKK